MLHRDYERDRVLVLHLVDVDRHVGPLAVVRVHVCLQTDAQLFDDLQRRVVCNLQVRRLPPMDVKSARVEVCKEWRDIHGVTATKVVHELGAGQKRIRCDDLHTVDSAEGRREQSELPYKQRLSRLWSGLGDPIDAP